MPFDLASLKLSLNQTSASLQLRGELRPPQLPLRFSVTLRVSSMDVVIDENLNGSVRASIHSATVSTARKVYSVSLEGLAVLVSLVFKNLQRYRAKNRCVTKAINAMRELPLLAILLLLLSSVILPVQLEAGMMTSVAANADRVAAGSSYAFANGGNELLLFKDGAWAGGGSYWGDGKVVSTFHQFNAGTAFQFGTADNHKNPLGLKYSVTDFVVFQDIDTVVAFVPELKNIRLNGVSSIAATSRLSNGTVVINTTAGNAFAEGAPLGETFNGPLRAGEAWVSYPNNIAFNNIDPTVIGRTVLDDLNFDGLGVLPGASGHGVYNRLTGEYLGQTLGGVTAGPFATGYFLDISNQVVRDRINNVSFSAVPEPTSVALAVAGTSLLASLRLIRRVLRRDPKL